MQILTKMILKIKRIKEAIIPRYAHQGDAGMDVFSLEDYDLQPRERRTFQLGFSMEFEKEYVALIWDKSGLASKHGIKTMGGVIDHNYRGEYAVVLLNTSDKNYIIKKGDKIAQILIQPVMNAEIQEVDELSETTRGEGGFGSTGK